MVFGSMRGCCDVGSSGAIASPVGGDAFIVLEDFNDCSRRSHFDSLVYAPVVHAVVTLVEFDVVVDIYPLFSRSANS